jgi:Tfp pilus assembly protein PilO
MSRFLIPILFVALAIGSFFFYTQPMYQEAIGVRTEVEKLQEAQTNMDLVLQRKQELLTNYNALQKDDITRLEKLMPDNLDNIKLIIDIDNTAKKYGLILNSVKFDVDQKQTADTKENLITGTVTSTANKPVDNKTAGLDNKDYNSFGFSFTTTGTFDSFNKLMTDIEKNLRIVDITSVSFDATDNKETYKFEVKAKIYWLKTTAKLDI